MANLEEKREKNWFEKTTESIDVEVYKADGTHTKDLTLDHGRYQAEITIDDASQQESIFIRLHDNMYRTILDINIQSNKGVFEISILDPKGTDCMKYMTLSDLVAMKNLSLAIKTIAKHVK